MSDAITVMHFGGMHETPTGRHAWYAATQIPSELGGYYKIVRALMLAGFCLLCSTARGQFTVEVLPPVPTFRVIVIEPIKATPTFRQWYLVSESWCQACPVAKRRFLKLGWPEANILTIEQCRVRFGFRVPYVPYEFGEPVKVPKARAIRVMQSDADLIRLHDSLHNQASGLNTHWSYPGNIRDHLRSTHHVQL